MAEFGFTEAQEMWRRQMATFCQKELAPGAKERQKLPFYPKEITQKLEKQGLLKLAAPEEFGGQSIDWMSYGIAIEEIAKAHSTLAMWLFLTRLATNTLNELHDPEIRRTWIPQVLTGEKRLAFGITEPGSGSDASALKASAREEGNYYILNGEKTSMTGMMEAHAASVTLRTGPNRTRDVSSFFVPVDFPGVSLSRFGDTGWIPMNRGAITLDNVRIPKSYVVGQMGESFHRFASPPLARVVLSTQTMGIAQASVNDAMEYAKQRMAFGRPIAKFEAIQFKIAEAQTIIDAGRYLCYRAFWSTDQGTPSHKEISMAKWFCPRMGMEICHDMLLVFGHVGYCDEHPMEQRLRDVIGYQIGDGTAEIQKIIIARETMGKEFLPYR